MSDGDWKFQGATPWWRNPQNPVAQRNPCKYFLYEKHSLSKMGWLNLRLDVCIFYSKPKCKVGSEVGEGARHWNMVENLEENPHIQSFRCNWKSGLPLKAAKPINKLNNDDITKPAVMPGTAVTTGPETEGGKPVVPPTGPTRPPAYLKKTFYDPQSPNPPLEKDLSAFQSPNDECSERNASGILTIHHGC